MIYNVSYDLNTPGQKYDELHKLIVKVSNNNWCRILKSTYVIKSDKTSEELLTEFNNVLDKNDYIFISEVNSNYTGFLNRDSFIELKKLIPSAIIGHE